MEQQQFDFTRGDQLGLLDDLVIPNAPGIKGSTAKAVLRVIDSFGVRCYASAERIAERCDLGLRTIKRATKHLEQVGFLITPEDQKRKNPNGSVTKTRLIDWTLIAARVQSQVLSTSSYGLVPNSQPVFSKQDRATMAPCLPEKQVEYGATLSKHGATLSKHGATVSKYGATVSPNTKEPQEPPPTAKATDTSSDIGGGGGSWMEVESRLRNVGLERVASAIAIAHQRNLAPAQVLEVIGQFESNRSRFRTAGAIVDRLRSGDWCQPIRTPEQRADLDQHTQAKRDRQARDRVQYQICREWQQAKIWHTKTTEEIEAEIDRRLSLTLATPEGRIL